MNKKTKIYWNLHNFCEAQCSYCPSKLWGGSEPRHISEYMDRVKKAIIHYDSLGKQIDWFFTGGEPLHYFDFPEILKICKENGGTIDLTTNGGKIWLDWWAVEPHIDNLNLSYHYWQNPNLIKFILDIFKTKNKSFTVHIPIRPTHFEEDMERVFNIENTFDIIVSKQILYKYADPGHGMFEYTKEQLGIIKGEVAIKEQEFRKLDYAEQQSQMVIAHPSYTGMICSAGIDALYITEEGWVTGSQCGNRNLGNIWAESFQFPVMGHKCGMVYCFAPNDKFLTKISV